MSNMNDMNDMNEMNKMNEIVERFLDQDGKIYMWPAKNKMQRLVLEYLANQFERDREYSEHEVNDIIDGWHTFNDYFLLRRGLIDECFLSRTKDGARYWR